MRATRLAAIAALLIGAAPAAAQHADAAGHQAVQMPSAGIRGELIRDIEGLEQKYVALADAMNGKYAWRPAEGVRSVGEVFSHIAGANFMLPTIVGIEPPESMPATTMPEMMAQMQKLERVTDEDQIRESLHHSFMHVKHAVAQVPDAELESMIKLFGSDATKRAALVLLVSHMHEHLGQAIAYARSNGVVPPWSGGGD
jgi:uncharacterized damage-inducible protein DinB